MGNTVLFARIGAHAVITLNRPQALNALNAEMVEDLTGVIQQVAADSKIGALVIKGSGSHFRLAATSACLRKNSSSPQAIGARSLCD